MADTSEERVATGGRDGSIDISLQHVDSHIRASDGREIPFARAVLTIRNSFTAEAVDVILHATLGQEGGTVQDVTSALTQAAPPSIPPDGTVRCDVYDLLLPAHPGTASKVHMFGYRAAMNWRFDLAAWAEYRLPGSVKILQTPVSRWAFHWSVVDQATGAVDVTIETV